MEIKTLDPDLGVTGQIAVSDLPAIVAAGYRSIICNRPDHEGSDQPD
ncbi:MAG: TIGR01244 family phosphatase, partial [Betaproteobacteria bacterium]|nr:TIGR01244 family phosphatase [Betaproteobacteria bacterium]